MATGRRLIRELQQCESVSWPPPATSATSCPGWTELDGNAGTVAIAAGLLTVYQLHKDGSVWRSTGVACTSASSCPGWTELDDNQGTAQISVSNGSLAPA